MDYEKFKFSGDSYVDFISRAYGDCKDGVYETQRVKTVTLQITDACNLKCSYCYQHKKGNHAISFETATEFIDNLLNSKYDNYLSSKDTKGIILEFIGGEPFLQVELIDKIVDYFYQRMLDLDHPWLHFSKISICSNGVLYFSKEVQDFLRKHRMHIDLTISIDGNKELHDSCRVFADGRGSYDLAISAAKHFVKHYGTGSLEYMGSKMTISKANLSYLYEAVKSLIDVGYTHINLNCVYEDEWDASDALQFYNSLKCVADYLLEKDLYNKVSLSLFDPFTGRPKPNDDVQNWCGGNGAMLAVDYKGDLFPCIRYMESSLNNKQEPYIIGTVENGVALTNEQSERLELLRQVDRKTSSSEKCFNCSIAEGCSWCTAYNYECFGTPKSRVTNICIMHKARVLVNSYYWNKIYRLDPECAESRRRFKLHISEEDALSIIPVKEWVLLKLLETPFNFT